MDDDFENNLPEAQSGDGERDERLEDMTDVVNVLALWEKTYENRDFYPVPILNR